MVRDRFKRSLAQSYRWIIAGTIGAIIGNLNGLGAGDPSSIIAAVIIFTILLIPATVGDYLLRLSVDPESSS